MITAPKPITRIALYEAGETATYFEVDPKTKLVQQDGSDFRKVNPLGLVPTLRTDDGMVLTSAAATPKAALTDEVRSPTPGRERAGVPPPTAAAMPLRDQNAVPSKPPTSRSGPLSP